MAADPDPHRTVWWVAYHPESGVIRARGACRAEDAWLQPGPHAELDADPGDLAGLRVDPATLALVPVTLN